MQLEQFRQVILDLTPGFNGLGKDNCKTRRETFKFWDLVRFILEVNDIFQDKNATSAARVHKFFKYLCQAEEEAFEVFTKALRLTNRQHVDTEITRILQEKWVKRRWK